MIYKKNNFNKLSVLSRKVPYTSISTMSLFSSTKSPETLLEQRAILYGEVSKLYQQIAQIDKELKVLKEAGEKFTMPKAIKFKPTGDEIPALETREFGSSKGVKPAKVEKKTSAGVATSSKKAWTIPKMKEFCTEKKIDMQKAKKRDEFVELIRSANKVREMDKFMNA